MTPTATPEMAVTATPTPDSSPTAEPTPTQVPGSGEREPFMGIVTSDYVQGSFSLVGLDSFLISQDILSLGGDTIVSGHEARLYFMVSSFGGPNALEIRETDESLTLFKSIDVGTGTNPRDVAFAQGKGYVALFNGNAVKVFNPANGQLTGTLSFSEYADPDGDANPAALAVVGSTLYVTLVLIDYGNGYAPVSPGKIVAIDTTTDQVLYTITTTGFNLAHMIATSDGNLLVSSIGNYGQADGGIERINTTTRSSEGFLFTDAELNRQDSGGFVVMNGEGFAISGGKLLPLDLGNGTVGAPIQELVSLELSEVWAVPERGQLWLGDTNNTITVYYPFIDAARSLDSLAAEAAARHAGAGARAGVSATNIPLKSASITSTDYGLYDTGYVNVTAP